MTPAQRTHTIAPAVASAAAVHAAVTLSTVPLTVTTAITSPDVCRVLSITGNAAGIAGNVTATGADQNGDACSDVIALNGTATVLGDQPFATVTQLDFPARTHAADTVSVGYGDVFGLPGHIGLTSDVTLAERKATGATDYTSETVGAVSDDYGTVAAVIVAGDTMRWTYYDRGASGTIVSDLREMIAEPTTATWSDDDLLRVIEQYPLIDSTGYEPDDLDWTPTYDLNAAASTMWGRKASALAAMYDFKADGMDAKRSQLYQNAKSEQRRYGSMRMPQSLKLQADHHFERDYESTYWEKGGQATPSWVVNQAEEDDE